MYSLMYYDLMRLYKELIFPSIYLYNRIWKLQVLHFMLVVYKTTLNTYTLLYLPCKFIGLVESNVTLMSVL